MKSIKKVLKSLYFYFYGYYLIMLVMFSFLIGITFFVIYSKYMISSVADRLHIQAVNIANKIEEYDKNKDYKNGLRFIGILQDVYTSKDQKYNTDDFWIISNKNGKYKLNENLENIKLDISILSLDMQESISKVFEGETITEIEDMDLYGAKMMSVMVPIKNSDNNVIGAVIINSPVTKLDETTNFGVRLMFFSILIGVVLVFVISIFVVRNLIKPIIKMKEQIDVLSKGDYNLNEIVTPANELGDLENNIIILSDTLRKGEEKQKNLDRMKNDFFANISHELKTPITVIRAYTESFLDNVIEESEKNKYYSKILNECKTLQRLIFDLTTLSKLQNSDFDIDKEKIELLEMFDDLIQNMNVIAKSKNIEIILNDIDYNCENIYINADYVRLKQMFLIIIDNAIKFSYENSKIEINIENKKNLIVRIIDYGIGIDRNDIEFIFDKFYKSSLEQNEAGSGLGLAIAKQIANRHNIDILVDSEKGIRTEFTFIFNDER